MSHSSNRKCLLVFLFVGLAIAQGFCQAPGQPAPPDNFVRLPFTNGKASAIENLRDLSSLTSGMPAGTGQIASQRSKQQTANRQASMLTYAGQLGGEKIPPLGVTAIDSDTLGNTFIYDGTSIYKYNSQGVVANIAQVTRAYGRQYAIIRDGFAVDPAGKHAYLLTYWNYGGWYACILKFNLITGAFEAEFAHDDFYVLNHGNMPSGLEVDQNNIVYAGDRNAVRKFDSSGNYLGTVALPFNTAGNHTFEQIEICHSIIFIKDGSLSTSGAGIHIVNGSSYKFIAIPEQYYNFPALVADDHYVWTIYTTDPWNAVTTTFRKYQYDLPGPAVEVFYTQMQGGALGAYGSVMSINRLSKELLIYRYYTPKLFITYPTKFDYNGTELSDFYTVEEDKLLYPMETDFDSDSNSYVTDGLSGTIKRFGPDHNFIDEKNLVAFGAQRDTQNYYQIGYDRVVYPWPYVLRKISLVTGDTLYTVPLNATITSYLPVWGLTLDSVHNVLYLKRSGNLVNNILTSSSIEQYDATTGAFIKEIGTQGPADGQHDFISCLTIDKSGNLFASDLGKFCVHVYDAQGNYVRKIGSQGAGDGQFLYPTFLSFNKAGILFVGDNLRYNIQGFSSTGAFVASAGGYGDSGDRISSMEHMKVGPDDRIYISDTFAGRVVIFENQKTTVPSMPKDITGIEEDQAAFEVFQNFPNAFSRETSISFRLPQEGEITIEIMDVTGRIVKRLTNILEAGVQTVAWDGKDGTGDQLKSGMYLYRVQFGNESRTLRMIKMD